jgi:hypothetical protein
MKVRQMKVTVTAGNGRFDPDDDRWLPQARELYRGLASETEVTYQHSAAEPGSKGMGLTEVAIAVGPAVVTGAVAAITVWLKRDRDRAVHLRWTVDGVQNEFTLTGRTVDNPTMRAAVENGLRAATGAEAGTFGNAEGALEPADADPADDNPRE